MKYLLAAVAIFLIPLHTFAFTQEEAQKQLSLEAENLSLYGNPFGSTGKFEELYDPITLKPWWQIQLEFEAWSLETYGNPFGYPMVQKVLPEAPDIFQPKNEPVETPNTVLGTTEPIEVQNPVETNIEPTVAVLNVKVTYTEPNCKLSLNGCPSDVAWDSILRFDLADQDYITESNTLRVKEVRYSMDYDPTEQAYLTVKRGSELLYEGTYTKEGSIVFTEPVEFFPGKTTVEFTVKDVENNNLYSAATLLNVNEIVLDGDYNLKLVY